MLYFDLDADWKRFNELQERIEELKTALLDLTLDKGQVDEMTKELSTLTAEFNELAKVAAVTGSEIEQEFTKRLENAKKVFNGDDVEKIGQAYNALKESINFAKDQLADAGERTKATIKELEAELVKYNKAAGAAFMRGDDKTSDAIKKMAEGVKEQIKEAKANLDEIGKTSAVLTAQNKELDESYQKTINNAKAHQSMRTQIYKLREGLIALNAEGKRNTEEYKKMQQELGTLTKAYRAAGKQAQVFGSENANLQGVLSGLSGLSAAFSVGQGAIGMFATESENLTKVLTKVQSIMAVTNGLQTISNTLNENSAFRLKTLASVQELWNKGISQTSKLFTVFGMSANKAKIAATALNGALTMGVGIIITLAISAITKLIEKWQAAKKAQEEFNNEVAKNSAKPIASIQRLATEFERLDLAGREKFVKANAKAFEELGVAVNSVADAENLLIKNKDAFINAQMSKAMAAAAQKMAQDKAEDYVKLQMQKKNYENEQQEIVNRRLSSVRASFGVSGFTEEQENAILENAIKAVKNEREYTKIAKKIRDTESEMASIESDIKEKYNTAEEYRQKAEDALNKIDAKRSTIEEKSVDWYNERIAELRKQLGSLTDTTGAKGKEINDQIEKYQAEIDKILNNKKKEKKTKETDPIADAMATAKSNYAAAAAMMASTNTQTANYGRQLYDKLKEQGKDYLSFLINLRDTSENLTESQRMNIENEIATLTAPTTSKDNPLDKALAEYKTFTTAKKELDEKYQQDYFILAASGRTEELKELEKAYSEAMVRLKSEYGKLDTSLISKIMSDVSSQTRKDLEQNLKKARQLMTYLRAADKSKVTKPEGIDEDYLATMKPEDIKDIVEQMEKMQEAYLDSKHYPFDGIVKGLQLMKEAEDLYALAEEKAKKGNEEMADSYRKLAEQNKRNAAKQVLKTVENSLSNTKQLAENMQQFADACNNADLAKFASGLSDAVDIAQGAINGAKTGGVWGALASIITTVGSKVLNSKAEDAKKESERKTAALEFQTKYNQLLSQRNYLETEYQGLMGSDKLGRAQAAWTEAQNSLQQYNKAINKSMSEYEEVTRNYTTSFLNPLEGIETKATEILGKAFGQKNVEKVEKAGAKIANTLTFGLFNLGGKKSNYNEVMKSAQERGLNDLQSMVIQTQKRKWWNIKKKDEYKSLYDIAPELWGGDKNGEFDAEAAKLFLETNKDITGEQRKQIEQVITLKEQYDDALKVVQDMAKEIVGSIGNEMTDAIVNSIENGADAWSDFQSSGANAIKALGKEMVQSLIYKQYLKKYEDNIAKAIGEGDNGGLMKIIGEIGERMPEMYSAGQELLKTIYDKGEQLGYQMYNTSSQQQSAVAGAFQTMSQDQAGVLEARFTAVYESNLAIHGAITEGATQIANALKQNTDIASEARNILANSYLEQVAIREATQVIRDYCKEMNNNIADVNKNTKRMAG